jgi:hypothetical protein
LFFFAEALPTIADRNIAANVCPVAYLSSKLIVLPLISIQVNLENLSPLTRLPVFHIQIAAYNKPDKLLESFLNGKNRHSEASRINPEI